MQSKRCFYIYLMSISERAFCFWDAKSEIDTYAIIFHMIISTGVLCLSCRRLCIFRSLSQEFQDRHLKICSHLHILASLWSLMFLIQNSYSVFVFFNEINVDPSPTDISNFSKIYVILDKVPVFIVQTIFLWICIFNYVGLLGTILVQNFNINHKFYQHYIYYIFYGRIILQGLGILSLIIFQDDNQIWTTSTINIFYQVLDSIVICIILTYSLIVFVREGIDKNRMGRRVKSQIKKEYMMMIMSGLAGVIVNIIFLIYFPFLNERVKEGNCIEPTTEHWDFFIGHNIIGLLILHEIPVFWFLKMYNYKGPLTQHEDSVSESYSKLESFHLNNSGKE